MQRVADYIMDRLCEESVKDIFMLSGRGLLYLTDALAKNQKINPVCMHHEQSAAYAAMSYAQTNETVGCCMVSTGCGATNAITGVLCAWQDSVPCIVISGQNMLHETTHYTGLDIRTYGSQEADIIKIVEPITKYAVMITDPTKIAYELDKAFYQMKAGRKGPVWIDVPLDIQNARIDPEELIRYERKERPKKNIEFELNQILLGLQESKRPVILIGSGIRQANAIEAFENVIELLKLPVVYSPSAADTYGKANPYSIGTIGSLGGTREGNFTIQNADYVLSIGSSLSSMLTGSDATTFARQAKVAVVDIDIKQHKKEGISIDLFVEASVDFFLEELIEQIKKQKELPQKEWENWANKCLHWKEIFPLGKEVYNETDRIDLYQFGEIVSTYLPKECCVITDAGFEELIIPSVVTFDQEKRCIHPAAQGAMGYALPASIGAAFSTEKAVIAIIGDGSFMLNMQELQTIVQHKLPVKIFIINNNLYSVITKRQTDLFRERTIGTNETNGVTIPSYKKVAAAFGISYYEASNYLELKSQLPLLLEKKEAIICEVQCVYEQRYLHESIGKNAKKRLMKKPIEDLSPFLDREVFWNEMIIEPLDK